MLSSSLLEYGLWLCGGSPDPRTPINKTARHTVSPGSGAGGCGAGTSGWTSPTQGVKNTPLPATGAPSPSGPGPDGSPQSTFVASTQVSDETPTRESWMEP